MKTTRFYRLPDVCRITGLSASAVFKFIREDRFPGPVKVSPKCSVWTDDDINTWIEEKKKKNGVRS